MATTSNIRTLHVRDTLGNNDTVEWCPIAPYQNYLVVGTYSCTPVTDDPGALSVREGMIILYALTKEDLLQTCCVQTGATLDLKWCPVLFYDTIVLAAATGTGEVRVYHMADKNLKFVTRIILNTFEMRDFLTLSLDWPKLGNNDLICSSDSGGFCYILKYQNETLTKLLQWEAHSLAAWTCCFDTFNPNLFFTGGDDNKVNMWDIRSSAPMEKHKKHSSGVTALSCHPFKENCLLSGSYDETIMLWDTRNMKESTHSINSKGGVWRLKWKPREQSQHVLASCIFGGFSVLDPFSKTYFARYRKHDSLAYGSDWCRLDEGRFFNRGEYLVALCSFYDHKLSICVYDENVADCKTD